MGRTASLMIHTGCLRLMDLLTARAYNFAIYARLIGNGPWPRSASGGVWRRCWRPPECETSGSWVWTRLAALAQPKTIRRELLNPRSRSTASVPAEFTVQRFCNARRHRFLRQRLAVVWSPHLTTDREAPGFSDGTALPSSVSAFMTHKRCRTFRLARHACGPTVRSNRLHS